jgi:hypothetical protein
MTSFTFTVEQLRAAPPEVRRWIEREIAGALAALDGAERDPSQVHAPALAACEPEEALQLFDLIKGNFLLSQVFFELTRDTPDSRAAPALHAFSFADILRHTRLTDGDRLIACFNAINQAFQRVRNDPEATLFGFDQYGHVYVHETTHRSIRQAWEQALASHAPIGEGAIPAGFALPRLGPSEDIAQHAARPGPAHERRDF